MKKRGRRTKLSQSLQRELCRIIAMPCTIQSALESTGLSTSAFHERIRRGEAGERHSRNLRKLLCAQGGVGKIRIARSILDSDDARVKLEYLSRVYPAEFGRREVVPLPPQPPPPEPSIRFTVHRVPDVDVSWFMELKAKLAAAGIKTDFPVQLEAEKAEPVVGHDVDVVSLRDKRF